MFGGDESEVSMADASLEWAILHLSEARASSANAFFGCKRIEYERAIIRHLLIG